MDAKSRDRRPLTIEELEPRIAPGVSYPVVTPQSSFKFQDLDGDIITATLTGPTSGSATITFAGEGTVGDIQGIVLNDTTTASAFTLRDTNSSGDNTLWGGVITGTGGLGTFSLTPWTKGGRADAQVDITGDVRTITVAGDLCPVGTNGDPSIHIEGNAGTITLRGGMTSGGIHVTGTAGTVSFGGQIIDTDVTLTTCARSFTASKIVSGDSHLVIGGTTGTITLSGGLAAGSALTYGGGKASLTVVGSLGGAILAPSGGVSGLITVKGPVLDSGVIEVGQLLAGGRITVAKDLCGLLHLTGDLAKGSTVTISGNVAGTAGDAILVDGDLAGTIKIVGAQTSGAGVNRIHILGDMTGTVSARQFGNAIIEGDWSGKWLAAKAGAGGTLQIYTRSTGVFSPANAFDVVRDALGYLARVEDQFHRTFDVFTDSDAAGNHFFARGRLFGDGDASAVPPMIENWPDNRRPDYTKPTDYGQFLDLDRVPGVDCIKATFQSDTTINRLGNWGGWYFMNGVLLPGGTSPSENWGEHTNAGVDLRGATKLTFWARGEQGGERVEFFALGAGRDANTGKPQHTVGPDFQPDSSRKVSTGYVTLSNQWKQYTIALRGKDLSYVLGGFGWVTNARNNGYRDITFYIDDIQYDKPRPEDPRFLVSYQTTDPVTRNAAFTYDNALALLAFLARGDQRRAELIADAVVYAVQNDRTYRGDDALVRNGYKAGDKSLPNGWTPNGYTGTVPMPGWYDEAGQWHENEYPLSTNTGNVAWTMLGLLAYYDMEGGNQYLSTAELLGDWVQANCLGSSGVGYTGGLVGPDGEQTALAWKSTEHNIDLYAAFDRLYLLTGDAKWNDRANNAKALVEAMWTDPLGDAGNGHIWTGSLNDGVTPNTEVIPLDVQAWAVMALKGDGRPYWEALDWAEANLKVGGGYDYSLAPGKVTGVWSEGTAQMAAAFAWTGQTAKADSLISYLKSVQDPSGGLYATDIAALPTGFGDNYYHWLHVGATAWLCLAEKTTTATNPFWLGAEAGWSVATNGSTLEIAYGSGTSFPQYAALHTNDSYFRMNYGPTSGWGTSAVLLPALWTGGQYHQGAPISATWRTAGPDLVLTITGTIAGLTVDEEVWIAPPAQNALRANVAMQISGSVVLDNRPGEAFKVANLSSMNEGANIWDAQSAFIGAQTFGIPSSGWIVDPPLAGSLFGLNGGTSSWKTNAPTIRVQLYQDRTITGWVTPSGDPNDDNVGFWAASDAVPTAWQFYTLTASA